MAETLANHDAPSRNRKQSLKDLPHRVFTFFLITVGLITALTIWARNYAYYLTPLQERPTLSRYDSLRPSGIESHGYGVIGTAMIFIGVATYSSRKRLKKLANFGKIRDFLDFHIFMCLVGPILVMYHTTFLFGGIAGAGFWCMTAVVVSGFIGRYFYKFIPKNIEGRALTSRELETERENLTESLVSTCKLDETTVKLIDEIGIFKFDESQAGLLQLLWYLAKIDLSHWLDTRKLKTVLRGHSVPDAYIKEVLRIAKRRIAIRQRMLVAEKIQQIFHYWHVIHLPFSLVMLVILIVHVGVAIAFGYTWIF